MDAKRLLLDVLSWGGVFSNLSTAFGQEWTPTGSPTNFWFCLASSADGCNLIAVVRSENYGQPAPILSSTNCGASWRTNTQELVLQTIAASADATKLVASYYGGPIYVSTNSGDAWAVTSAPVTNWTSLASSADGTKLVAVASNVGRTSNNGALICTSTNSGITWMPKPAPDQRWTAIACSADGTRLLAAASNYSTVGLIYVSTNSGDTWTVTPAPSRKWQTVASSASGEVLAAGADDGPLCTSTNGGASWTEAGLPPADWRSISASADGNRLVATSWRTGPCFSTNSGAMWVSNNPPAGQILSIASSADGCRVIAKHQLVVNPSVLYTWQTTPTPVLNITPSESGLCISWIVPSMPFVLQESPDLATSDWTDVMVTPILNLANLHHEVLVPLSSAPRFYRLKSL